ncbi:RNA polymerase sigma factor [Megamonas hypermegale]|uniref:RNA polymerase sigma factor n=1 Tax=Megamonas hypermegale TaxID=158847 RepID=UPI0026EEEB55|nr:sigma-70 family RNA polymerase sigma factor [Megamonas hypermegale]
MENELIIRAQAHDEGAVILLMEKYKGLIHKAASQNHLRSIKDEAYSEACLGFYEAVMSYDERLGVPFAGFSKSKVYAKVHSLFRKYLRVWQNEVSACNKEDNTETEYLNLFEDDINIEENIMCKIDLRKIVAKLSFKQRIIFNEIVLHGKSRTQTAEKLGISVQAVNKTYNKALAAITKYLQKGRE